MDQCRGTTVLGDLPKYSVYHSWYLIVILFCQSAKKTKDEAFRFLYLAVIFSFACYIPVVLFADTVPPVGMLMIPKTCAYVWVVLIGYKAMKGSENY